MKQYRLKKWYPSLAISWRTDDMFEYDANNEVMTNISNVKNGFAKPKQIIIKKAELHPDFWELIEEKKPLFITEDGVEITDGMQSVIAIDSDINVEHTRYQWANKKDLIFGSKEGADEYIWRNKPVFSYNDFMKWGNVPFPKAIEQLAKERIEG